MRGSAGGFDQDGGPPLNLRSVAGRMSARWIRERSIDFDTRRSCSWDPCVCALPIGMPQLVYFAKLNYSQNGLIWSGFEPAGISMGPIMVRQIASCEERETAHWLDRGMRDAASREFLELRAARKGVQKRGTRVNCSASRRTGDAREGPGE